MKMENLLSYPNKEKSLLSEKFYFCAVYSKFFTISKSTAILHNKPVTSEGKKQSPTNCHYNVKVTFLT